MEPPILSVLALRHADDQSVELLAHRNLARQARIEFSLGGKAEHARLLRPRHWRTDLVEPGRIDIDVAGGAGALAATIGVDARQLLLTAPRITESPTGTTTKCAVPLYSI